MSNNRVYNPKTKKFGDEEENTTNNSGKSVNVYNPNTKSYDDIAPVSKNTNKWAKGGAFEDGYDFGDVTKTILGTSADITTKVGSTLWNMGGEIGKLGAGGVAQVADWIGQDEWANKVRNRIAGKDAKTNKILEDINLFNKANQSVDRNSVLGDKSDKIVESIAQIGGYAAATAIGLGTPVMVGTAAGSSLGENYAKDNVTNEQAWTNALAKGGMAALTERLFGFFGTSGADTAIANKISSKLTSGLSKSLARLGVQASAEAVEELLEYTGDQLIDMATDAASKGKGAKFHEDWNWEEVGEQMGNAFLSSMIFGAGVDAIGIKNTQGQTLNEKINNYARQQDIDNRMISKNDKKVIDLLVQEQIDEKTEKGEKVNKKEIEEQITNDLEKGRISVEDIEKRLGGEAYDQYKNVLNQQEELKKKINTLENTKLSDMTYKQQEELKSLREELDNLKVDEYKKQLSSYVNNLTQNDNLIRNSYNEEANRSVAYTADLSKYSPKQQEIVQKAIDSGILNNTNRTHDMVDLVAKLAEDKGLDFDFVNNEKLKDTGFVLDGKTINGYTQGNTIGVNIDSNKALNQVIGHEITHILEGTDLYEALKKSIKEYATTRGEYEAKLNDLRELYKEVKDANIENELTSDLVGEYLFTDEEFIKRLSVQNRNLFQKIYDEIKYLVRVVTAGSKEAKQLEQVKRAFEKAYRNTQTNISNETKYSIVGIKNIDNAIKNKNLTEEQRNIFRKIKNNYEEAKSNVNKMTNEELRQEYGWFQDKNNDWKFEITDAKSKLKINPEKNKTYKLGELFDHKLLYDLDPKLKNMKVVFKDMEGKKGSYFVFKPLRHISLNNNLIDKGLSAIRSTLLHEIQHHNQYMNNFEMGASTGTTLEDMIDYVNSLGEIESTNVQQRMNLTQKELKDIAPESSKENPKHPNESALLQKRVKELENKKAKEYNKTKKGRGIFDEEITQDIQKNKNENSNILQRNGLEELNNSSFSLDKYAKRYEDLTKTNYIEYFTKDNGDVRINMLDSNNNLVNQFDLYNKREAIKELGENLGSKIYESSNQDNQKIEIGNDINNMGTETDYFMTHRPTETGITADDLIKQGNEVSMPKDIYEHLDNYVNSSETAKETIEQLKRVRNNPNADVTIYRATIGDKINKGDWVTLSKNYAELHNESQLDGKGNIIEKKVKASDIQFAGDVLEEWGYFPNSKLSLSNQNEDIAPIGNYQIRGEDVKLQDIAPIETKQKETTKPKIELPINPTKEEAYESKPTRHETIQKNRKLASEYLSNMNNWKDTPLFKQKINTMKRNLRDIMPTNEANAIYNEYFAPISKNNATIERETKEYNKIIENLKLNKNESIAVQLLGELKYNPETTLESGEVYDFINKHNLNEDKINSAVDKFREVYDELFGRVNKVLEDNGYTPIGYKKGYFPHFTEEHGKNILGKLAEKLGWKFNSQKLPTDIAGLTDTFTPGKKWVSFAQHRTGDLTEYNALKGFDNYIRGAMQVIHHTEDIQKLRGLENEIRYRYSDKGIQEKLEKIFSDNNLDTEEKQRQIDSLLEGRENGLGNFVMNLREYTNNLAGKKSATDRSVEFTMGRNIYNTMNNISSRVSANMVGLNLSSALTNFIPITQAWSQVSTKNMLRAMKQTIANNVRSDGFIERSDYLTNRIDAADKLYKTNLEKVSDKAGVLFDAIDSFSSQVIVRGKYLDNIQSGMSESEAMNNANEFAKDVMAGRSQGDKPTIFNSTSPITKLFTAFQLEVNNQYGYMFKDLPNDMKDKGMGLLIGAFIKMFLGAWLYNKMAEELTGRKSAFSPIDIVADSVETAQREDLDDYGKISTIAKDISDEAPFVSGLLGGGRLPINSALPDISTITENALNLKDEDKKDAAIKNIQKEFEKPLFYAILPFGGGQLKKTKDALSMYDEDLPIAGSYTPSGNLRFTADDTPSGKIKAALFGQYSSKEAQEYVNSGYKTISSKKIQELKDLGMTSSEYRKYSNDLKASGTKNSDKIDFISNSNYSDKQKDIMAKNVLGKDIDMKKYKNYGSYEEADYAINNPEKYLVSKVVSNTFDGYKNYTKELNNIKADKDSNGKSISNSRKTKVINYINSLNEDYGSKLILYKMEYPSDNSYNSEIVDYLNNKDNISLSEEKTILKYLGMTITDKGTVRW